MKINLKELYELQAQLDQRIIENHHVSYEETFSRRLLSLIVELGELANETRCFKYWSNKGPSPKDIVMDEFADGLHFYLSLGIPLKEDKYEYEIVKSDLPLTEQFLLAYEYALKLKEDYKKETYEQGFNVFLNITASLDMSVEDIIYAYKKKLDVNYVRQNTNY